MSSTIKIKRTTVAGKSPTNANLSTGELAINLPDGRLYSYSGSRIFEIGANVHSLHVGSGSFSIGNGSITFPNAVANTGFFLGTDGSGTLSFRNTTPLIKSQLANTNTYIATKANSTNPTTSGVFAHTGRATISTNLTVSGNTVVSKLVANGSVGTAGYVLKSTGSGVYWDAAPVGSGTIVSLTTTALKDLTQNDTVVTSAQATSATNYLQVANAVSTFQTKAIERSALANTNSFIKSQLANTNTFIATKVNTTTFNSALANTNTYIATKLDTSTASTTYQTKAIERAALANTNTFIATKVNTTTFNSALANTNTFIATKVATTTFNSALANTNSYIKSQLANTNTFIATKVNTSTFNSALANTNTYIATKVATSTFNSALANTNTYIATKPNSASPTTTGVFSHTGRATISTNLSVTANTSVGGDLTVGGNLTVNGTTTTVNSTTVSVDDKNIELGSVATPTDVTADGGGITLKGSTDKTLNWISATSSWTSSENVDIAANKKYRINGTDIASILVANTYFKTILANTNSFIKSQLANTNTYIATKVNTTTFNSALANTNSFIKSQLANTNLRVNLINTNLTSTNTAIRLLVSDRLQVANAAATYATKASPTTSGVLAHTGRATISTNLTVSGNTVIGKLVANGSVGTAGYALKSNGSTVYWDAVGGGQVTTAQFNSALANTNTFIATKVNTSTFNSALANTNTYIATKTNSASPTTSGVFAHTGRATISTNLNVSGNTVVSKLVANGSVGTAGYVLKSTGSGVYWDAAVGSGTVISLTTTALKDLTQNDTVVTSAQTISASGYLQVANAVSTFQTKSIERAALANTNSYIRSQLANTNAYIAGGITSASRTANATPVSTLGASLNLQDLIVANPAGYLSLVIGGNTYKVPYFA